MKSGKTILIIAAVLAILIGAQYWWKNKNAGKDTLNIAPIVTIPTTKQTFVDFYNNRKSPQRTAPTNFVRVETVPNIIAPCLGKIDGPCGFNLYILAQKGWETKFGPQPFYFEEESGAGPSYYGPYEDNLMGIIIEARLEAEAFKK